MMKQVALVLVTAILALGMVACQSTSKGGDTQPEANTTAQQTPAAQPAPQQAPKKPEWQEKAESMAATGVEWASTEFNFGTVPSGTKVTHQFRFTNTGQNPLVLTRVKASCGCTTPAWSQEPIAPGQEGFIDISFDSSGKSGTQAKSVTVTGNFEGNLTQILRIRGEVGAAQAQ